MRISASLFSSSLALFASAVHGCGMFDYFEWIDLPDNVRQASMDLGIDQPKWDEVRTSPVTYLKFADVIAATPDNPIKTVIGDYMPFNGDIKEKLMTLDVFDDAGVCWDFYVNHYDGYTWAELADTFTPFGHNVQDIVATLGWDEAAWDDTSFAGPIPDAECKFWITLDPIEKWAYRALGWDGLSFDDAPCGKYILHS